ncbi:zinc-binding dehydrogenase [Oceanicella actignis]|uniref:NADPH:quinone reductase n=1 Tax=Oceanicella actignis TaxID=1189325 RepID=A0A1M7S1E0_9RHOB|nr:zinc-binding dehydrogenase [Oceanicella actignis]TYO90122.1 NADPH:quinone reductase-like Zn-dependent oxidoreductase [Oceanicella actignis]SES92498.1 NADPH:quinone reductase [Oceanicella actignis]SHN52185.1 NADPH:quinone reductase [Oceanicella actignis]
MTIPQTMKAVVQLHDGYSGTATGPTLDDAAPFLELREIPVPQPAEGQVLIKVAMASVNPSDIHFIKGEYGQPRVKGAPAGFEGCGTVVAGKGAYAESLVGQRVAFVATHSGAWAEYALTDASACIPVRPDLRDEDAAAQIVNPLTAMAMFDIVREDGAESFVFTAAGSQLGKLAIGLGRDHGIPAIATVRREAQAEALRALGAAEVLVTTAPDFHERFAAVAAARKPRILLDAVGDQNSADMFFAMRSGARWITYGKLSSEAPRLTQMGQFIFMNKRIEGFWLTRWMQSTPMEQRIKVVQEVQERFATGKWRTDVSARLPLDQVVEGLAEALRRPDGKVMITP